MAVPAFLAASIFVRVLMPIRRWHSSGPDPW
jgi:hypothetical protein